MQQDQGSLKSLPLVCAVILYACISLFMIGLPVSVFIIIMTADQIGPAPTQHTLQVDPDPNTNTDPNTQNNEVKINHIGMQSPWSQNVATKAVKAILKVESNAGVGTGFLIDQQLVITNHHVVKGAIEDYVTVYSPNKGEYVSALIVFTHQEWDLACLVMTLDITDHTLRLAPHSDIQPGDLLMILGFPSVIRGEAKRTWIEKWDIPVASTGMVTKVYDDGTIHMDADAQRGNSGSPVINHKGLVVGVAFATTDRPMPNGSHGAVVFPVSVIHESLPECSQQNSRRDHEDAMDEEG